MLKKFLTLAVIWLWLYLPPPAAAGDPAPALQRTAAFEPAKCTFEFPIFSFLSPGWFGFECGYVTVPERHGDPNSSKIRLAVAVLPGQTDDPAPDPLFMAQGGPGGSSLELFPFLMLGSPIREERDIVIFDQRGTLYSEPNLLCPELDQLTKDTIERDLTPAESDKLALAAYQACGERLAQTEGVNLAAYNSLENAADIDAVRQALGYDRINFYGVSYGTLLGLHYMRQYPASLRSVILDAVVPTQGSFLAQAAQSADRAFKEVAQLCAADAACNTAYPNLEDTIYEVMAALNKNPVRVPVTDPDTGKTYRAVVNGDLFISALFLSMYDPSLVPTLPTLVYNTRAGDYDQLSALLPLLLFQPTFSTGMYQAVICAEEANFQPEAVSAAGIRPELAQLMQDDNTTVLDICRLWKIPELGPEVNAPVVSDVPTLLLSGQFDPITPPTYAQAVAERLSNGYAFTFPNTSHGAFISSPCADQIVRDFLDNPGVKPEAGCLAGQPTTFEIPTPATLIMTPAVRNVLEILNGHNGGSAGLFLVSLLVLGSFYLVWPAAWLIRKLRGSPPRSKQPAAMIAWGGPLLVILVGGLTLLLLAGLVILVASTDLSALMIGVPKASAPLFIIPPALVLLTLGMMVVTAILWVDRCWSFWRRGYYSLLTLAAILMMSVLAQWGMLTVFL